jgi:RNA polymerase sigma-70 factor (ECF subfamily)
MAQHGDRIFRLCRAYLYDPAEADDLYQEVWINVWKALPRFREEAELSTFLYRITVNTAVSYNRRIQRQRRAQRTLPDRWPPPSTDAAEKEAQFDRMYRAIARLSDADRLLVGLLLEDLSYREMAEVLGISVNYVGVKISRVKEKLKAAVAVMS